MPATRIPFLYVGLRCVSGAGEKKKKKTRAAAPGPRTPTDNGPGGPTGDFLVLVPHNRSGEQGGGGGGGPGVGSATGGTGGEWGEGGEQKRGGEGKKQGEREWERGKGGRKLAYATQNRNEKEEEGKERTARAFWKRINHFLIN